MEKISQSIYYPCFIIILTSYSFKNGGECNLENYYADYVTEKPLTLKFLYRLFEETLI